MLQICSGMHDLLVDTWVYGIEYHVSETNKEAKYVDRSVNSLWESIKTTTLKACDITSGRSEGSTIKRKEI